MKKEKIQEKKSNRGRKKVEDKKLPVTIYLKESTIKDLGGMDKTRDFLLKSIK